MTGFTHTIEGGGHIFTCDTTGWAVWEPLEARAAARAHDHTKRCKHHEDEEDQ